MATLTAANSVITIGVTSLFPVAQQLQGFAVDDMFTSESVTTVETMMGVDNILSGGWIATSKKITFALQADSISNNIFDTLWAAQEQAQEVFVLFGEITLRAIERSFTLQRGFMTSYTPLPDAKKLLQPRRFTVEWQRILPAPI